MSQNLCFTFHDSDLNFLFYCVMSHSLTWPGIVIEKVFLQGLRYRISAFRLSFPIWNNLYELDIGESNVDDSKY